jgi:hypothetical protein
LKSTLIIPYFAHNYEFLSKQKSSSTLRAPPPREDKILPPRQVKTYRPSRGEFKKPPFEGWLERDDDGGLGCILGDKLKSLDLGFEVTDFGSRLILRPAVSEENMPLPGSSLKRGAVDGTRE